MGALVALGDSCGGEEESFVGDGGGIEESITSDIVVSAMALATLWRKMEQCQ